MYTQEKTKIARNRQPKGTERERETEPQRARERNRHRVKTWGER